MWVIIDEQGSRYLFAFLMHHICDYYTFGTGKGIIQAQLDFLEIISNCTTELLLKLWART